MEQVKQLAERAARKAGALLKERVGHIKTIDYKSAFNLVTDVDRESERLIVSMITETFPDDQILGEEGGARHASGTRRWLIDPLDGTTNFTHGYPCFCVSIGCEDNGELIAGVVFNPMADELFWAMKGKGAYLNDKKISVSQTATVSESLLATGFPADTKNAKISNVQEFVRLTDLSHGVRRDGSAAIDLCQVACGRLEAFWELKLAPWDLGAGVLMVREAGGTVTNAVGGTFEINKGDVISSNGKIHDELVKSLDFATAFGTQGSTSGARQ
jgi:myo-inositol-1(or 4)-monophosphatase